LGGILFVLATLALEQGVVLLNIDLRVGTSGFPVDIEDLEKFVPTIWTTRS